MSKNKRKEQRKKTELHQKQIFFIFSFFVLIFLVVFIWSLIDYNKDKIDADNFCKVGDEIISKPEFDFYYDMATGNYLQTYDSYLDSLGLDRNKSFSEQKYDDNMTWEDFFCKTAIEYIQQTKGLLAEMKKNNVEIDVEAEIDEWKSSLEASATDEQVSLDFLIEYIYGEGTTEEEIAGYLRDYLSSTEYYQSIMKENEDSLTTEEIDKYISSNTDNFKKIKYRDFSLSYANTNIDDDGHPIEKGYDEEAEKEKAENKAKEFMGKVTTEDSFNNICMEYVSKDEQEYYKENKDFSLVTTTKATTSESLMKWLGDESRKTGDKTVLCDEDTQTYHVLFYISSALDEGKTVNVRQIYVASDTANSTEGLSLEEAAEQEAKNIFEEWNSGEKTEDSFSELATNYNSNDSYYQYIKQGDMEASINDWIFGERKVGDCEVVEGETGYYILYFCGDADLNTTQAIARETIIQNKNSDFLKKMTEKYPLTDKKGNLKHLETKDSK